MLRSRKEDPVPETTISAFTSEQIESTLSGFTDMELASFRHRIKSGESHRLMPQYVSELFKLDSITEMYLAAEDAAGIYHNQEELLQAKIKIINQLSGNFTISSELRDHLLYAYQNEQQILNPTEARLQLLLTRHIVIDYSRRGWNICDPISQAVNIVTDSTIFVFFPFRGANLSEEGDSLQIASIILGDEAVPVNRCRTYTEGASLVIKIDAPARLIKDNELLLIKFIPYIQGYKAEPLYGDYLLRINS